jgi:hypothetical protein
MLAWNDRRADEYHKCAFEDLYPQHACRGEAVHKVQDRLADVQKNHEAVESQSNLPWKKKRIISNGKCKRHRLRRYTYSVNSCGPLLKAEASPMMTANEANAGNWKI